MINVVVGDVIVLPFFPDQEDKNSGRARWVLIIEDQSDEFEILPLTKQLHQSGRYQNTIEIVMDSEVGRLMGLEFDSLLILDRSVSLPKGIFKEPPKLYKRGRCPSDYIDLILERMGR